MGLSTQYPLNLLIGDDAIVWGTAAIGPIVGQVRSLSLKRTGDQQEILDDYGSLRAFLLTKVRSEVSLQILFDADVTAPGLGEEIGFPLVGVSGRILDVTPEWSEDGARLMSIEATHWDSMDNGSNAHDAYYGYYNTGTGAYSWEAIA